MIDFDYQKAFSRNLGWLTQDEQNLLRKKRIAIAGLGGAGGSHLLALSRLGIGAYHLADFDTFDFVNFNRQAGANIDSLGQSKTQVMAELAQNINPELDIRTFDEGVQPHNLQTFLDGVDLYVDGLDYFAFSIRQQVYNACQKRGIPIIFAVPFGMGASLLNFLPNGPSFEEYFQLHEHPKEEWPVRFLVGLAPSLLHRSYLVYPEVVNFKSQRVPSTGLACELCAGMAGTVALKILLGRGKVHPVPHSVQFDAYTGKLKRSWRPGGNRHPLNKLAIWYVNWRLKHNNHN